MDRYDLRWRPTTIRRGAAAAVTDMRSDDITTVILEIGLINTLLPDERRRRVSWQPEWTQFTAFAPRLQHHRPSLPPNQSAHTFRPLRVGGAAPPRQTECYQAYRSIDPDNEPDGSAWQPSGTRWCMMMNGIQEAGPKLTQKSFDEALFKLGHRFPPEPWAIGGGYGPDDYSYMDDMSEIWFDENAVAPNGGWAGRTGTPTAPGDTSGARSPPVTLRVVRQRCHVRRRTQQARRLT